MALQPETPGDTHELRAEPRKRKVLLDTSTYTLSLLAAQTLGLLRGAIVAGVLGPSRFGIWTALGFIVAYSPYTNLGIFTGMAREYAIARGKGDDEKAELSKNVAFTFGMMMAAIGAAVIIATALLGFGFSTVVRVGLVAMGINVFIDRFFYFQVALFRLEKKIGALSLATLLSGIFYTVAVLSLIDDWNIYILFLALPVSNIPSIIYLLRRSTSHFRVRFDKKALVAMIAIGLPVDSIGLVDTLTQTLGGIVGLLFLTTRDVGFFGVGMTAVMFLLQVPTAIGFITNPYLLERYGATEDVHAMEWYSVNLTRLVALVMPLVIGISVLTLPPLIRHFLPEYTPGISAIQILICGSFFYSLNFVTANFLVALNKQKRYAAIRLGGAVLYILLLYLFLSFGLEVEGIALAYAVTGLALGSSMVIFMLKFYVARPLVILGFLAKAYAPLLYGILLVGVLFAVVSDAPDSLTEDIFRLALRLLAFVILYVPVLLMGARRMGIRIKWPTRSDPPNGAGIADA